MEKIKLNEIKGYKELDWSIPTVCAVSPGRICSEALLEIIAAIRPLLHWYEKVKQESVRRELLPAEDVQKLKSQVEVLRECIRITRAECFGLIERSLEASRCVCPLKKGEAEYNPSYFMKGDLKNQGPRMPLLDFGDEDEEVEQALKDGNNSSANVVNPK